MYRTKYSSTCVTMGLYAKCQIPMCSILLYEVPVVYILDPKVLRALLKYLWNIIQSPDQHIFMFNRIIIILVCIINHLCNLLPCVIQQLQFEVYQNRFCTSHSHRHQSNFQEDTTCNSLPPQTHHVGILLANIY